jgi:hypothetical protein
MTTDINAPAGFEPTISAGERPQNHALDCAATGTGSVELQSGKFIVAQCRYVIQFITLVIIVQFSE